MKARARIVAVVAATVVASISSPTAFCVVTPAPSLPAASSANDTGSQNTPQSLRDKAELEKLRAEVEKLHAEITDLEAVGPHLHEFATVMTAVGGLLGAFLGAIVTAVVAYMGHRITDRYNEVQSGKLQQERDKLRQDRILGHEKHDLELYQGLGNASPRAQFAAAAVLLQRLENISSLTSHSELGRQEVTAERVRDVKTIVHVLIALLKERTTDSSLRVLQKHVADNLIKNLVITHPLVLRRHH